MFDYFSGRLREKKNMVSNVLSYYLGQTNCFGLDRCHHAPSVHSVRFVFMPYCDRVPFQCDRRCYKNKNHRFKRTFLYLVSVITKSQMWQLLYPSLLQNEEEDSNGCQLRQCIATIVNVEKCTGHLRYAQGVGLLISADMAGDNIPCICGSQPFKSTCLNRSRRHAPN